MLCLAEAITASIVLNVMAEPRSSNTIFVIPMILVTDLPQSLASVSLRGLLGYAGSLGHWHVIRSTVSGFTNGSPVESWGPVM